MSKLFQACNVAHFTSPTIPLVSQPLTLKGKRGKKKHIHTKNNKCQKRPQKQSQLKSTTLLWKDHKVIRLIALQGKMSSIMHQNKMHVKLPN